jgi:hypothetical protein
MPLRRCNSSLSWLLAVAACALALPAQAAQWLPVTAEDLQMTADPQAPKAPAVLLYRQVDRDDSLFAERQYIRIKVLTDEGREAGNVEIRYDRNHESIHNIQARTIRPDGSTVDFDGTVYDTQLVETQEFNERAKTFALPDVQVGSIIEYRFSREMEPGTLFNSHWILNEPLFTKDAKFSLVPNRHFMLRYSWPLGLPEGTIPPVESGGAIRLEAHNLAPFVREERSPPDNELRYRVDFIYVEPGEDDKDPTQFWTRIGKKRFRSVDEFVDEPRVMAQAVAQIVAPDDSADIKLRKIYARVQQLHNLSFEPRRSKQEQEHEHQKKDENVADVWQRGYGGAQQLNWLFLGLVRAAGIPADDVLVSNRDVVFFDRRVMHPGQLNASVILVKQGDKDLYLDPGAAFTPFGMLPWGRTGVTGLRLDKDGGEWVHTPLPAPAESRIEHKAELKLSASGALEGRVTITRTGLEARAVRVRERNEDEAHRRQFLENLLKGDVPSRVDVELTHAPDWDSSEAPFVAEYQVSIPEWVTMTGQRALLTAGVFAGRGRHLFEHATRIHPVYFAFPFDYSDDVRIELPATWKVASLPKAYDTNIDVLSYRSSANYSDGSLQLRREVTSRVLLVEAKYYDPLRDFFQTMRSGDAEQVVVAPGAAAGGHASGGQ